jgi:hypothetical protein
LNVEFALADCSDTDEQESEGEKPKKKKKKKKKKEKEKKLAAGKKRKRAVFERESIEEDLERSERRYRAAWEHARNSEACLAQLEEATAQQARLMKKKEKKEQKRKKVSVSVSVCLLCLLIIDPWQKKATKKEKAELVAALEKAHAVPSSFPPPGSQNVAWVVRDNLLALAKGTQNPSQQYQVERNLA